MMPLTPQELRVLRLASYGMGTVETAKSMGLASSTVKTHRKNVLRKMGARTLAHAVALAYEYGMFRQ